MSTFNLGDLALKLTADISDFKEKMEEASDNIKKSFASSIIGGELVANAIEGIAEKIGEIGTEAFKHLEEVQTLSAQTAAAIRSTGGAAGVSAEQIKSLAENLAAVSGVSPEVIQRGDNMLLTFQNIKNGVGSGNDVFNQATKAALNMSVALGTNMAGASRLVGRALNDPAKGLAALTRVGVTFTAGQKAQIMAMEKAGNVMGAQKLILEQLKEKYGGSAEAFGQTLPGAIGRFKTSWDNLTDSLTSGAMPAFRVLANDGADAIAKVSDAIKNGGVLEAFDHLTSPLVKAGLVGLGVAVVGIAYAFTASMIPSIIAAYTAAVPLIAAYAPFLALGAAIAVLALPIAENWTALSQDLVGDWNQVQVWFQGFIQNLQGGFQSVSNVVTAVASYISSTLGAVFNMLPGPVKSALGVVGNSIKSFAHEQVVQPFRDAISGIGANIVQPLKTAFVDPMSGAFGQVGGMIHGVFSAAPDQVAAAAKGMAPPMEALGHAISHPIGKAAKAVKAHVKTIASALQKQQGVLETLANSFTETGLQAQAFGASFDTTGPKISALKAAINALIKDGVSPASPEIQRLVAKMASLSAGAEATKKALDANKVMSSLSGQLADITNKSAVFGSSFDAAAAKTNLYKSSLQKLLDDGLAPTDPKIVDLKNHLDALKPPSSGILDFLGNLRGQTTPTLDAIKGLQSGVTALGKDFGITTSGPMSDFISKGMDVASNMGSMGTSINQLVPLFAGAGTAIMSLGATVLPMLGGVISGFIIPAVISFGVSLSAAIWPITLVVAAIAGLIAIGELIYENWQKIAAFLKPLWDGIANTGKAIFMGMSNIIGGAVKAVSGVIMAVWNGISNFLKPMWNGLMLIGEVMFAPWIIAVQALLPVFKAVFTGLMAIVKDPLNFIIGALNLFIRGIDHIRIPAWVPGIGGFGVNIPEIPYLAAGGIATGPSVAMIGEAGPEAIVPLNDSSMARIAGGIVGAMRGGNTSNSTSNSTAHITIQYSGNVEELGDQLVNVLRLRGIRTA